MWIRDTLPARLPHVRFYIYGYDTSIAGSTSAQNVQDISGTLINTLEAYSLGTPNAKPLIFLAHSLGGVVLKQALVQFAKVLEHEFSQILSLGTMTMFWAYETKMTRTVMVRFTHTIVQSSTTVCSKLII